MNKTREQALFRLRKSIMPRTWPGWDGSVEKMRQLASLQVQAIGSYEALADELEERVCVLEAQAELDKECFNHLAKRGLWTRIVAYWKGTP
jgi:hypothetical protein